MKSIGCSDNQMRFVWALDKLLVTKIRKEAIATTQSLDVPSVLYILVKNFGMRGMKQFKIK